MDLINTKIALDSNNKIKYQDQNNFNLGPIYVSVDKASSKPKSGHCFSAKAHSLTCLPARSLACSHTHTHYLKLNHTLTHSLTHSHSSLLVMVRLYCPTGSAITPDSAGLSTSPVPNADVSTAIPKA